MRRKLSEFYFTVDPRSLGLFRILLATLLIIDWFTRWPDLEAFYTSFGVLPIESPLPKPGGEFHFCLLDGATSLLMVRAVFCFGLICYFLMLVGFRTRLFQVLSFVFFVSVVSRNVLIRDGSVVVMETMLLWSLFLPMARRFSLDALLRSHPVASANSKSLAAFAIVAQVGLIYLFTAIAKHGSTWKSGTALYYALNLDHIARPLGQWLVTQPSWLIKTLTWGTLVLEFAALPLILLPFGQPWLRRAAIVSLTGLHLGIALTTTLAMFPAAMIATYALLLLPAEWECISRVRLLQSCTNATRKLLTPYLRAWRRAANTVPGAPGTANPTLWTIARAKSVLINAGVGVLFIAFTVDAYNLNVTKRFERERVREPRWMRALIQVPLIEHNWELFAPNPTKENGWWVIAGETASGEQVDPLTGKTPNFEKPRDLATRYDRYWRKYLERIWLKKNYDYRLYFGKYITRKNHRECAGGSRLARFDLYYVKEETQPPGTRQPWPTNPVLLWHHECLGRTSPADASGP
jgi:hypothetical protein